MCKCSILDMWKYAVRDDGWWPICLKKYWKKWHWFFFWHDYFVVKFQSLLTKNQEDTPVSQHAGENQFIG